MAYSHFPVLRFTVFCLHILVFIIIFNLSHLSAQVISQLNSQLKASTTPTTPEILTPPSPKTPLIHSPKVFGVRPNSPFLYTIPATGDRPMTFQADQLPNGLQLDQATGQITGVLTTPGTFQVTFSAQNSLGKTSRPFTIVVGDTISLTPPMGWNSWNSWNCWGTGITQDKTLSAARDFIKAGLDRHGWTYINIDEGWEGTRGGQLNAIQPDPKKFTDIKSVVDQIHAMGLKVGIYSTPWVTGYDNVIGSSSNNADGAWDRKTMSQGVMNIKKFPSAIGQYHFFTNDANQWAAWGFDYLKFAWNPNEVPETKEMADALRASGRDMVYSLSNQTSFASISQLAPLANCWRITGDIGDSWGSIVDHGFHHDKWAPFESPGHWNDPDMFEVGAKGGGKPKRLTADEQYTHVSQWCLLSAPLLLGCDLDYLDDFTIGLLSNDEVLDVDQDELGKQALNVSTKGKLEIYAKPLFDGSWAVGLFNLGDTPETVTLDWNDIKISGEQTVRDLWRQKDLGQYADTFSAEISAHGVKLIKLTKVP